jgi:hypothetical protein
MSIAGRGGPERGATAHRTRLLDAPGLKPQTARMAEPKDLMAVDVHTEDVGDYNVTEAGWYAVDDGGKVVLGPFDSLAQCERAIRDRPQRTAGSKPGTPT